MQLPAIAKLDLVLKIIADDLSNTDGLNLPHLLMRANDKVMLVDAQVILDKLIKDGYVITKSFDGLGSAVPFTNKMYAITFEGLIFYESGGYTTKINLEKSNSRRTIRNEVLLMRGTWFAGIMAGLLLLWDIIMHFLPKP